MVGSATQPCEEPHNQDNAYDNESEKYTTNHQPEYGPGVGVEDLQCVTPSPVCPADARPGPAVQPVSGSRRLSGCTGLLAADTPKHSLGIASGMHARDDYQKTRLQAVEDLKGVFPHKTAANIPVDCFA